MRWLALSLFIAGPGLATSDTSQQQAAHQALQAAAFPTIPYPGVGKRQRQYSNNTMIKFTVLFREFD